MKTEFDKWHKHYRRLDRNDARIAFDAGYEVAKRQEAELRARAVPADTDLVRYCPACASIGVVEGKYRDCCPDGNGAAMVPKAFAEQCRSIFKVAIGATGNPISECAEMLCGFDRQDMLGVADGLDAGYEKRADLGEYSVESTTACAARFIRAVIESAGPQLVAQAAVPDGWKLVPVEPTDEMVLAPGALRLGGNVERIHRNVWACMLAAAPQAPQPQAVDEASARLRSAGKMVANMLNRDATPVRTEAATELLEAIAAMAAREAK